MVDIVSKDIGISNSGHPLDGSKGASWFLPTMAANGSGLQMSTVRNLALAWILTLPVAMALSFVLFIVFRQVF